MQDYLDKDGKHLKVGDDVMCELPNSKGEYTRATVVEFFPIRFTMRVEYKDSYGNKQRNTVFTEHTTKVAGASDV